MQAYAHVSISLSLHRVLEHMALLGQPAEEAIARGLEAFVGRVAYSPSAAVAFSFLGGIASSGTYTMLFLLEVRANQAIQREELVFLEEAITSRVGDFFHYNALPLINISFYYFLDIFFLNKMLSICNLRMAKAKRENGAFAYGEDIEVEVILEGGFLKYFFANGEKEDIVRFGYCCDSEETLKEDIVDYLYRKNEEDVLGLQEGEECYAYVAREPKPVEAVAEGGNTALPLEEEEKEENN